MLKACVRHDRGRELRLPSRLLPISWTGKVSWRSRATQRAWLSVHGRRANACTVDVRDIFAHAFGMTGVALVEVRAAEATGHAGAGFRVVSSGGAGRAEGAHSKACRRHARIERRIPPRLRPRCPASREFEPVCEPPTPSLRMTGAGAWPIAHVSTA